MADQEKIEEVIKAFEDFGNLLSPSGGLMEARQPLYYIEKLRPQMSPEAFNAALRRAAVNSFKSDNPRVMAEILNYDKTIATEPEVRTAAEKYLTASKAKGWEDAESVDEYFANILKED